MRDAPSRALIESLLRAGAEVLAYDPVAMQEARRLYQEERLNLCATMYDAIEGADALAVMTEWREFRAPGWDKVKSAMRVCNVFDGRNFYHPASMKKMGVEYYSIGRG